MKKLLCIWLSALLLLAVAYCPSASAAVNYCAQFENAINQLRWYAPYRDIEEGDAFPVSTIINYTKQMLISEQYGEEPITEGNYTYYARYAIPADVFESAALDYFGIVDISALRSYTSFFWDNTNFTGIDNFQNYQEDRHVYLFSNSGGMGDPSRYQVVGYAEEDGRYRVYSRFLSLTGEMPEGIEGEDYVRIGTDYYEIEHYLETVLTILSGRVQFHSWQELDRLPDRTLTTPLQFMVQTPAITIAAAADVFPEDTTIEISAPDAEMMQTITAALTDIAVHFVAYDFALSHEPKGTVQVTFTAPEEFDGKRLGLFFITEDGDLQRIDAAVDPDAGTITAELSHFSIYVVAELLDTEPIPGDVNGDRKINVRDARLILQYTAGLLAETEIPLALADFNGDGSVNTRDARAILGYIAGLE